MKTDGAKNIREIAGFENYYSINREERNYAALLYAALLQKSNMMKFLNFCKIKEDVSEKAEIYFEYSLIRDLWKKKDNKVKAEIIKRYLGDQIKNDEFLTKSFEENNWEKINDYFGVFTQKASSSDLQYPGNWSIKKFYPNFKDTPDDFLAVCKFKWAFNIKPDLVVHLPQDKAICIETKYESNEGKYPSTSEEKNIFKDIFKEQLKEKGYKKKYIKQTVLQEYMMNHLLGIDTTFVLLCKTPSKIKTEDWIIKLSWKEVFKDEGKKIDTDWFPPFAKAMRDEICKE